MKQINRKQEKNISKRLSTKTIKSEDVYNMLLTIPKGKVSTYGDLAKALGNPAASRHIGRILNKNQNPIKVPCHRVVMSNGNIGGYAFGTQKKKELLQKEGVIFTDEYRLNEFSKVRYYPKKE
ncbi:MAG TPA: MGMT family protein [Candidatus Nitrosocosmicus sp.]|jgi:methylated-DNA-[protein]-cysteine S-methyltransferase|nr:MGMT family protein [Candidatus Nitrosocosmicus sp.]